MTTNNAWNSNSTYTDFQAQNFTGFSSWAAGGPYFDDTTLGTFRVLVGGTGYIKSKKVTWVAQNITGLAAGNTYFIYIDSTGTIGKTTTRTDALFTDNIVLFECLRDSTPITNNQVTVKENHPYDFQAQPSNYLHNVIGSIINNTNNGANITLNGTQGIQINGADALEDHGLETTIPDSGGVAQTWIKMYTDGTGKWARQNATNTFTGFYNNAGTPTALGAGKFAVYTLYVSKDNLNTTTPTYLAVLDTSQYNNQTAAQTAITNGTTAQATNELRSLEIAQLGYIIYAQGSASIVQVIISKSTLRQTLSTSGTNTASLVNTNTSAFNGWLSAANTNVQSSLDTLDDVLIGGTSGQIVSSNGAGAQPTFTTATYPKTTAQGDLLSSTTANAIVALAKDANATRYLSNTGVNNNAAWAQVNLANGVTGVLPIANGGTNANTMSTANGIVKYDGTSLVTSSTATLDASNRMTNTAQPAFLALTGAQANVTGDNTTYTVTFTTEIFDQANNFDGTSTFTAPVTGRYYFTNSLSLGDFTTSHTNSLIQFVTSNRTYEMVVINMVNVREAANFYNLSASTLSDMDAADTMTVSINVSGGTKVVDVNAANGRLSGFLVC